MKRKRPKTSQRDLDALLAASIEDSALEPVFFRALLDSSVYVHAPARPTSQNLQLVTFIAPEGITVIPVFTDLAKAKRAWSPKVRIIELTGRELFLATPGATFMINPNDRRCTLYPEEVQSLLETGRVAMFSNEVLPQDVRVAVSAPVGPYTELTELLSRLLSTFHGVDAAYLCDVRPEDNLNEPRLIVAIVGVGLDQERIGRAIATGLQLGPIQVGVTVDAVFVEAGKPLPQWLVESKIPAFFASDPAAGELP